MDQVVGRVHPVQCRWERGGVKHVADRHLDLVAPGSSRQAVGIAHQDPHAVAARQQQRDEAAADVAGGPGYQDALALGRGHDPSSGNALSIRQETAASPQLTGPYHGRRGRFCPLPSLPPFATMQSLPGMSLLRSEDISMSGSHPAKDLAYLPNFTARKVQAVPGGLPHGRPRLPRRLGDPLPDARRRRGPLRGGRREDRPAPRPLRALLHASVRPRPHQTCLKRDVAGLAAGARRRRAWRRRRSTTTWPRSRPSPPGSHAQAPAPVPGRRPGQGDPRAGACRRWSRGPSRRRRCAR